MIHLRTLGHLDLRHVDGRELRSVLAQPKRFAVLAYLAASPGFHRRDTLLGLFWPESSEDAARASLRTALSVLRRSVGEEAVVGRGNTEVGIDGDRLWCDVVAFEEALSAGELEQALELYGGELLEGFYIPEAPGFERWLEERRSELRRRAADAARRLAERGEAAACPRAAVEWARRAVTLAPDDEEGRRRLIALLDRSGDRTAAIRAYEEFALRLRSEFDVDPCAETEALVRAVRARAPAPPAPGADGRPAPSATAADPPAIPEGLPPTGAVPEPGPPAPAPPLRALHRPSRRTTGRIAAVGAVVILALTLVSLVFAPARGVELDPQRVVVVPFENRTGDPALEPLGRMAADWITQGIAETGLVEVVTSTTMLASWSYVSAEPEPPHSAAQYRALADETGAGTLVTGSFFRHADSLRYQVLVTDARTGRLLRATEPTAGLADAPLEAVAELRTRVMGVLATLFDPRLAMTTASASRPPTFESYRAYLEGTERFIRLEHAAAIPFYELSAALDPGFAHPRIFLGICLHHVGDPERADSVARTLDDERHRLSAFDVHLLDWLRAWIRGERVVALEAIRRATELVPTSEWLYVLSLSAHEANRPAESVEALRRLDPERGFMRGFVAYWSDLTGSLHVLGEHRRELGAAEQGRRSYPQDIMALRAEVRALAALKRVRDVEQRIEESLILPAKFGIDPGLVMRTAASELRVHGHPSAAAEVLERALTWHRSRPLEEQHSAGYLASLGQTLYLAGRWEEARAIFTELAESRPGSLDAVGHLGVVAARLGDHAEARRIDAVLAGLDRPFLRGAHTFWRARIAAVVGEPERAVQLLRDSFTEGRHFGLGLHTEMDFEPIRDHPAYRELVRPKG